LVAALKEVQSLRSLPPEQQLSRLASLVYISTNSGTIKRSDQFSDKYNGRNVLLGKSVEENAAVCRHRSLIFKILADEIGLQASLVRGGADTGEIIGNHAWNEVRLPGGKLIVVDVTYVKTSKLYHDAKGPLPVKYYDARYNPLYTN